jgi:hypothetical protein
MPVSLEALPALGSAKRESVTLCKAQDKLGYNSSSSVDKLSTGATVKLLTNEHLEMTWRTVVAMPT